MLKIPWVLVALAVVVLAVLVFGGQARALGVGDAAPNFTLDSALDGKVVKFSLKDQLAKQAVVLYFFPKAFTAG
jgi:peroxiredoxin Q/BCP